MDDIFAELLAAQMEETQHKLAERNVVDLLVHLINSGKVEVIYTKSGKEYLTHDQLKKEIEEEIVAHGGRLGIIELGPIIQVDMSYIQQKVSAVVNSASNLTLLGGEIISSYYLDGLTEEINQELQDAGRIAIVSLAQKFGLPADFLRTAMEERQGTLLKGKLQGNDLYTDSFVDRHKHRVRGILYGLTTPTPLHSVVQIHQLLDTLVFTQAKELMSEGVLPGTMTGSDSRAIYSPDIFSSSQHEAVQSFYTQNQYIEYNSLKKLEISNPKLFLKQKFPDGMDCKTLWLSNSAIDGLHDELEEAIATNTFLYATSLLPAPLTDEAVSMVLSKCMEKFKNTAKQMGSTLAVSNSYIDNAREKIELVVRKQAEEDAKKIQEEGGGAAQVDNKDDDWEDDGGKKGKKGKKTRQKS